VIRAVKADRETKRLQDEFFSKRQHGENTTKLF
jgi:hypothetical protein